MDELIQTVEQAHARAFAVRPKVGGFPYLAEALRRAGVKKYVFDVPSSSAIYVMSTGSVLAPGRLLRTEKSLVPPFDEDALVKAIRVDQQGESTFPAFVEATFRAGVVRYVVDTAARTCTYRGVQEEEYVEEYPAVDLPPTATE